MRPSSWLIPAVVMLALTACRTHVGWLDLASTASPNVALSRVIAAVVDIDATFNRQRAVGAGTGIVLNPRGLVLTNNHVVEYASSISATDANGHTYPATVLGRDRRHDLALLQLPATNLTAATLGDSSYLAVGDPVIAIGNAGGRGGIPSRAPGTVIALNETVSAGDDLTGRSERLTGMIEIAAAMRPGDSGGPLVNAAGQVVGVDTAGASGTQKSPGGQGFAIPIDEALQIAQQLAHRPLA